MHHKTDLPVIVFAGKGGVYLSENINSKPELLSLEEMNQKEIKEVAGDHNGLRLSANAIE